MARARVSALFALLVASCAGDDGAERRDSGDESTESACELGERLLSEALAALRATSPACQSDGDCVVVPLELKAKSADIQLCGDVLQRDGAAKWDPSALAREVDRQIGESEFQCRVSSTCASFHAVCRNQRCVGERD